MHPVLFRIGRFELHSWGVAFVIAILVGLMVAARRAPRFGVKADTIVDLSFASMIAAVVGSRLWYVVYHLDEFRGHWLNIVNPFQNGYFGIAGLSMMGGVVLGILTLLAGAWLKKLNFLVLGDIATPSFLLGAGIQRIGCFLNGCCFGKPTNSPLGVVFPPEGVASSVFPGMHLWPTQLFASALGFAGFALVLWLDRRYRFPGATLCSVFAYYSVDRFVVDQFRYYEKAQILGKLGLLTINVNDAIVAGVFAISVTLWIYGWRRQRRRERV